MHTATFSHEYAKGRSGPGRSYWQISRNGMVITTVCLHHRGSGYDPKYTAETICGAMDFAFGAGADAKAHELRKALGLD